MDILNPRTGAYDYTIQDLSAQDIKQKCDRLKDNQASWKNLPIMERIAVLQNWKQNIVNKKPALLQALQTDTGRHWETVLEVNLVADSIDRWCKIAEAEFVTPAEKTSSIPFINIKQDIVPHTLIGVISPWNFPLLLSLIDTIPALLAGCAVIVKPSEVTPRFIKVMQQTIIETDVLNTIFEYVEGGAIVGEALIDNCSLICFTGSTATGKKVYDRCSRNMIPVFLELGGKDPAIVLDGANIHQATSAILWGSTANAGQSCLSIERVYVHENIFDDFCKVIVNKAQKLLLTYPNMEQGQIAPIIFNKQVDIINLHLQDAFNKGATILCGQGQCQNLGGGYYLPPTVLVNVNHQMMVMQEETFGPIIPIMKFKTNEEAIQLANDTIYGLSGAVFAATNQQAIELAQQIDGGAFSINEAALTAVMHEGEKNSFKLSGIGGTRMGPNAIKRFYKQKVYLIKNAPIDSPWWYKVK